MKGFAAAFAGLRMAVVGGLSAVSFLCYGYRGVRKYSLLGIV